MIKVDNVSKNYGRVKVLNDVSLMLEAGKTVGIVGPSGSGKTTLLRIIAGLDEANEGTVTIDGDPASIPEVIVEPSRRNIGAVFQVPALWPHMTVRDNVEYASARGNAASLLEKLGISELAGRYPRELSGGEARRVSVARALAAEKKYLLLDEPLVNLNKSLKKKVHEVILEETRGREIGVLYITHDESEIGHADITHRLSDGTFEE